MVDWKLLEQKIEDSGLRRAYVYQSVGITRSGWCHKKNGNGDFSAKQIVALCDVLHITKLSEKEQIFFAKE